MKMSLYIPPRSMDKESTSIKINIKMPHNSGKSICHSHPVAWVGIHNSFKGRRRELTPPYCPQTSTCKLKKKPFPRIQHEKLKTKNAGPMHYVYTQQLIIIKNKGTLCLDWAHGLVSKVFPFQEWGPELNPQHPCEKAMCSGIWF